MSGYKLYRAIRTILMILTILSMLGYNIRIHADIYDDIVSDATFIDQTQYNGMSDFQKEYLNNYLEDYTLVIYYNANNIQMFHCTSISTDGYYISIAYDSGTKLTKTATEQFGSGSKSIRNDYVFVNVDYWFIYINMDNRYRISEFFGSNIVEYDVTLISSSGGSVSGSGTYEEGSDIVISATAETNYVFVGWFEDSEYLDLYSANSSVTIEDIQEDITLYAQFIEYQEPLPDDSEDPEQPNINVVSNDYIFLTVIILVGCLIYWNNVLKEYL